MTEIEKVIAKKTLRDLSEAELKKHKELVEFWSSARTEVKASMKAIADAKTKATRKSAIDASTKLLKQLSIDRSKLVLPEKNKAWDSHVDAVIRNVG